MWIQKRRINSQGKIVNRWCDYYIYGILKFDCEEEKKENNEALKVEIN